MARVFMVALETGICQMRTVMVIGLMRYARVAKSL